MNALFSMDQQQDGIPHKNKLKTNSGDTRQLLAPSCTELCNQCIEVPTYFYLSGYPLDSKTYNSSNSNNGASATTKKGNAWVIPHPSSDFRLLREEEANWTASRQSSIPTATVQDRFSSVPEIFQLIEKNMVVLNRRFVNTPFRFTWRNADPATAQVGIHKNFVFFYGGNLYQSNDYLKSFQHTGGLQTLNVYLMYRICGHPFIWVESNCITIGTCEDDLASVSCCLPLRTRMPMILKHAGSATNPSYQLDNTADGLFLSYDTLTGGG